MNNLFFRIHGNSMYPVLRKNDIVYIKKINSLKIGQIYCFKTSKVISHRLISINGAKCTFKGDTNSFSETIEFSSIIGEILEIHRADKVIKKFNKKLILSSLFILLRKIKNIIFMNFSGFSFLNTRNVIDNIN